SERAAPLWVAREGAGGTVTEASKARFSCCDQEESVGSDQNDAVEALVERLFFELEGEASDLCLEVFFRSGDEHVVLALHESEGGLQGAAGGVLEFLAGTEDGLLADDAGS